MEVTNVSVRTKVLGQKYENESVGIKVLKQKR
jgi:hypothetical protein